MTETELLTNYLSGPIQLQDAVANLSNTEVDLSLANDSWSIRQIVLHVVDGDALWAICIRGGFGPSPKPFEFNWYWQTEQDEWAKRWAYDQRPLESSITLLQASRQYIVDMLSMIPNAIVQRVNIQHPNGSIKEATVGNVLEMQINHMVEHVEEISKIRRLHTV